MSGKRVGPGADRAVARITWRLLLSRRRWLAIVVASGLPPLVAWVFLSQTGETGAGTLEIFYGGLSNAMVLTVLLPLMGLVHGTAAFGLEIDDGTLRYVLAKPLGRWRIVLVKWAVATAVTVVSVLPGVVIAGWILLGDPTHVLVRGLSAAVLVGGAVYGALFLAFGLLTRRALLLGLLYVLAWEGALASLFLGVRAFSVREYATAAARAVTADAVAFGQAAAVEPAHAAWLALGMLAAALALSIHRLRGLEVMEEV